MRPNFFNFFKLIMIPEVNIEIDGNQTQCRIITSTTGDLETKIDHISKICFVYAEDLRCLEKKEVKTIEANIIKICDNNFDLECLVSTTFDAIISNAKWMPVIPSNSPYKNIVIADNLIHIDDIVREDHVIQLGLCCKLKPDLLSNAFNLKK